MERDEEPEMAQRIRDVRGCVRHDLLPSCFPRKKADREFFYAQLDKNERPLCILPNAESYARTIFVPLYSTRQSSYFVDKRSAL